MADHRHLIERLMDVLHQRLEQAEQIGLEKLDEVERRGRRGLGLEEARKKHGHESTPSDSGSHRRRRSRSRHRSRHSTERPPTAERKKLRKARRRANLRLSFYAHFTVYASVLLLLVLTTRSVRAVAIVALAWGIGIFLHYFWAILAPGLRERWIRKEVGERVGRDVGSEMRRVEQGHVRSLEDLSASIAHEIRNPITAAKSLVQQMGEDPVSPENLEYAGVALEELDRVERSISHLLRFARDEEMQPREIEMAQVVESALETFRDRIAKEDVRLECHLDTRGRMHGDPDKLRRVVINLVGNALDAMRVGGVVSPHLQVMTGDNLAGSEVWLRIRDNGPGIAPETRAKIFDPFYTTKESGTGLGLALSKKIVDAHGGSMEVESSPELGTEFVVSFPKGTNSTRNAALGVTS